MSHRDTTVRGKLSMVNAALAAATTRENPRFVPPRTGAHAVARLRVLGELETRRDALVHALVAPAGFGKTAVLAQWRRRLLEAGADVAWLTLDAQASDWRATAALIADALAHAGLALDRGAFDAARRRGIEATARVLHEASATHPHELVLMLDDLHALCDADALRFVEALLQHAHEPLRFALASRAALPFALGRLDAAGRLHHVGPTVLGFDEGELHTLLGAELDAGDLTRAHHLCAGWPLALGLLGSELREQRALDQALQQGCAPGGRLYAWVEQELLAGTDSARLEALRRLAVCTQVDAALAACVTGLGDALALLEELGAQALFVQREQRGAAPAVYRFNPILARVLLAGYGQQDPQALLALHRRAALCCADRGRIQQAFRHALDGEDRELAADIAERALQELWGRANASELFVLLEQAPDAIRSRPRLALASAIHLLVLGETARVQRWLDGAAAIDDDAARLVCALLEAWIALSVEAPECALERLESCAPPQGADRILALVHGALTRLALACAGRYDQALRAGARHSASGELGLLLELGELAALALRGDARVAVRIGEDLLRRAGERHEDHSVVAPLIACFLAPVLCDLGRDNEATALMRRHHLETQAPIAQALLVRARARLVRAQTPGRLLTVLRTQETVLRGAGIELALGEVLVGEHAALLALGEDAQACDVADALAELCQRPCERTRARVVLGALHALAAARAHLASGNPARARAECERVADRAASERAIAVRIALLRAVALEREGRCAEALVLLRETLQGASDCGLCAAVGDELPLLRGLLAQLLEQGSFDARAQAWLRGLLGESGDAATVVASTAAATGAGARLQPRELEILVLLAESMSNKRIALTLGIAVETVKWNLKNIFLKLGVSCRYDAVSRGRKLGLLAPSRAAAADALPPSQRRVGG